MILDIFYIALGTIVLVFGANGLVGGASGIAQKLGISNLIIGMTVIAFGTSSPELFINVSDALKGNNQIGYGLIMGSNILNILLVLGITAVIHPIIAKESTLKRELPFFIIASISLFILSYNTLFGGKIDVLSRFDGIIMLLLFSLYLYYIFSVVREQKKKWFNKGDVKDIEEGAEEEIPDDKSIEIFGWKKDLPKEFQILKFPIYIVVGLLFLIIGSDLIVSGASNIAEANGIPEWFVGLTIVAIGTALPEIATNITAALKKNTDLAIGNIVGTNIFNSLVVLGVASTIGPTPVQEGFIFHSTIEVIASLTLLGIMFIGKKGQLTRMKGLFFLGIYVFYLSYTVWSNVT